MSLPLHTLLVTTRESDNAVFAGYAKGIRANSTSYRALMLPDYLALGKRGFEERIRKIVREEGVNCIFFLITDSLLDPNLLRELAQEAFIVTGFFDTEYYFYPRDRYYAQASDLVLLPDYLAQFEFARYGIPALTTFTLYDSTEYVPKREVSHDIPVSFVGMMVAKYVDRQEYLAYLKHEGVACETYGWGTAHGRLSRGEMINVFRRTKINLNFTGMIASKLPSAIDHRLRQSKGRSIEAALCGGFVLSQYAPGIEHMFEIGKEIDVFHTKEELLEKIHYYLAHDEEREAMATRAHERAIRDYDVVRGFAPIFEEIRKRWNMRPEKTLYLDAGFLRAHVTHHLGLAIDFFVGGSVRLGMEELATVVSTRRFSFSGFLRVLRDRVRRVLRPPRDK